MGNETQRKPGRPKKITAFDMLRPTHQRFIKEYALTGNGTQSWLKATPNDITPKAAGIHASAILGKQSIRDALLEEMQTQGLNKELITRRLTALLNGSVEEKNQTTQVNQGITHARAILGLDAPKESKHTVNTSKLTVSVEGSIDSLDKIITRTTRSHSKRDRKRASATLPEEKIIDSETTSESSDVCLQDLEVDTGKGGGA